jgi:hypothetical protein
MFEARESEILELMAGAEMGYLMQAHASVNTLPSIVGCNNITAFTDVVAAFLIGALT